MKIAVLIPYARPLWFSHIMYRLDLHIHTPASRCFAETQTDNISRKIVCRALESGLDMIAVTDHHSVEYVDKLRLAARQTRLVVLPGVELSTRVGELNEVYLLAIFDEHKPKGELDRLLADLGIECRHQGDCHFRIPVGLETIIAEVLAAGGLIISDHLDKTPPRQAFFPEIISKYNINAFELKNISFSSYLQENFAREEGLSQQKVLSQAAPFHFFTFSDAHRLDRIGRRYSEINLSECSFRALQQLLNPNNSDLI